ncbi:AAA family ATPase [Oceanirhabdus seepicola]|uniref:AAA family ATPase n=1 Tax=Oceanirhabdus seepicola TaxID=2828781 RepID=A0A9J6NYJ0_9CLOT|nr:AAA family ATPase [Oceanirhabdus seepicola]MCM1988977.1 AAA family ATPase [Oceanirhabdus seepicola]
MTDNLIIIVTGASATGKTTLSRNLAKRFNLSVINKDDIKELLFDNLGIKDKEWAGKLGMTSFEFTHFFTEKLAQTGKSFIVEGNFRNEFSTKVFMDIKSKYNYQILQIFCHGQDKILYERYIERDNSGTRHPGHFKLTCEFEEFKKLLSKSNYKLDIAPTLNIDTTNFEDVDINQIYDEVDKYLNSVK